MWWFSGSDCLVNTTHLTWECSRNARVDSTSDLLILNRSSNQLAEGSNVLRSELSSAGVLSQLWLTLELPEELKSSQASGFTLEIPRGPINKPLEKSLVVGFTKPNVEDTAKTTKDHSILWGGSPGYGLSLWPLQVIPTFTEGGKVTA